MPTVLASLLGLALFVWPLLGLGGVTGTVALASVLAIVLALGATERAARRLDSRELALLAAIAAIDAVLRVAMSEGVAGFSPIFFLVLCAGYVFGPGYGFVCGNLALLASGIATGGLGPWLPYEMLATGWVGAGGGIAALLRHDRRSRLAADRKDIAILVGAALVLGIAYGVVTDLWDWSNYPAAPGLGWQPGLNIVSLVSRFAHFYVATSLLWDLARSIGTAIAVVILGLPTITALCRLRARFTVVVVARPATTTTDLADA